MIETVATICRTERRRFSARVVGDCAGRSMMCRKPHGEEVDIARGWQKPDVVQQLPPERYSPLGPPDDLSFHPSCCLLRVHSYIQVDKVY